MTGAHATYTYERDASHFNNKPEAEFFLNESASKEPTCEENGENVWTLKISAEKSLDEKEHIEEEFIGFDTEKLGHDWGDVTYTWADDNSTVTASRTCKRDKSHVETETADAEAEVTTEPTATESGERTYTAKFENEAFETQTKTEEIPAAGEEEDPENPEDPEDPDRPVGPVGPAGSETIYRVYNPNSGEHFYTANANEKDHLVSLGWRDEGRGWTAPKVSGKPVYRLYDPNDGEHHYTMKAGEKNALVRLGWKYEGIGWYSDENEGVPVYRQCNPNATVGRHNYTRNRNEKEYLLSLGWIDEGIGWYGVK